MFIDDKTVASHVSYRALIDAIASGVGQGFTTPDRSVFNLEGSQDLLLNMPTWNTDYASTKTLTFFPGNSAFGRPSTAGCICLFERAEGRLVGLVAANELTLRRTAALSALAADKLANPLSRRLLVVGSGNLAPHLARAHAIVRSYDRIDVWGRSPERAASTVSGLLADGLPACRAEDLAAAQAEADVIACATTSTESLILLKQLRQGVHISLTGGFTPQMRESDSALIASADVWIDCEAAVKTAGDLLIPIAEGVFCAENIKGDLVALVADEAPTMSNGEITVFKSVGFAALDLIAARTAIEICDR